MYITMNTADTSLTITAHNHHVKKERIDINIGAKLKNVTWNKKLSATVKFKQNTCKSRLVYIGLTKQKQHLSETNY